MLSVFWKEAFPPLIIKVCGGIFQADLGSGIGSPYKLPPVPVSGTFLLKRLSEINC